MQRQHVKSFFNRTYSGLKFLNPLQYHKLTDYEYFFGSFCTANTLHLNYPSMLHTEIIAPVPKSKKYHTNTLWAICRTF